MSSADDKVILTIDGMDSKARGIGRIDGYVVFVPGALVGETILAKFVERRKHYGVAVIESILKSSDYRVPPRCKYYKACGGCDLQHALYDHQLHIKNELVVEAIGRIGKWPDFDVEPTLPSPQVWGYRNKAIFQARYQNGRKKLGYFAKGTHEVVEIEDCPILDPLLNDIYRLAKGAIEDGDITFYDEHLGKGLIRNIVVRSSLSNQKALIALVLSRKPYPTELNELKRISARLIDDKPFNLQGILLNVNESRGNFVWGPQMLLLAGEDRLQERLGAFELCYGITDFFQVNIRQACNICKIVSQHAAGSGRILELYSGVGTITCFLTSMCQHVVAVEEWHPACKSLLHNMAKNGLSNVTVLCGKAEEVVTQKVKDNFDMVVLDPPRTGCHRDVLDFIGKIKPNKIIYVSCNPVTLARDGKILIELGYKPESISPLDMFPQTSHVECVAVMAR